MKLSIITTIYKAENDLPRLLDSMMAQKSLELEFFLIDNGSPDNCAEICKQYAKKDSRFKLFTIKDNIGYIRARNVGIQECDGDYIGFCDSDDFLEPSAYDRAIEKIKETECDLYITSYRTLFNTRVEENKIPYEVGLYENKAIADKILPQTFGNINGKAQLHGFAWKQIFRRSMIIENNYSFMVELQPYEDQIFNIDVINKCQKLYIDDNPIYNYIVNEDSITAKLVSNFDAKAEWDRITLLYTEKKKRAVNNVQLEACSNQAISFIYSFFVTLSRQKASARALSKKAMSIIDDEIMADILLYSSKNGDKVKKFLSNKHYLMLILLLRLVHMIRK